ncbi:hypothetical protein [Hymenobacter sp. DG25A]|uniref:hypothetical protein n=1 Tax=Hymenobacter sp. DG25A TaxID=1385663 RepID=UPI0006BD8C13|nr:hypothetical protein [Hymenobacter sp. DG25A]ALD20395.1 hypothetical protein AM218_03080 [Hymenobacter sp. DG25A]
MKHLPHIVLALVAATALSSCDRSNSPGKDPQTSQDFTNAPPARSTDTNLDSVSKGQDAQTPIGTGSAADMKTSTDAARKGPPNDPSSPVQRMPSQSTEQQASTREE